MWHRRHAMCATGVNWSDNRRIKNHVIIVVVRDISRPREQKNAVHAQDQAKTRMDTIAKNVVVRVKKRIRI